MSTKSNSSSHNEFLESSSTNNSSKDFLKSFIENSKVNIVSIGGYGVGILVKLSNKDEFMKREYYPYKMLSLDNYNSKNKGKVDSLFIKFQILRKGTNIPYSFTYGKNNDDYFSIYSVTPKEFNDECKIQNEIFDKTNENLSPLCPPIFEILKIYNTDHWIFDTMIKSSSGDKKCKYFFEKFRFYIGNSHIRPKLNMGVIVMPVLNGETLSNYSKRIFKLNSIYNLEIQAIAKLIRLYDAGYFHNDLHKGNIIINPNEKYMSKSFGKLYFIDFDYEKKNYGKKSDNILVKLDKIINKENKVHIKMNDADAFYFYNWVPTLVDSSIYDYTFHRNKSGELVYRKSEKVNTNQKKNLEAVQKMLENMEEYETKIMKRNMESSKIDKGRSCSDAFNDFLSKMRRVNKHRVDSTDVHGTDVHGTDVHGTDVHGTDVLPIVVEGTFIGGTKVGGTKVGGTKVGGAVPSLAPSLAVQTDKTVPTDKTVTMRKSSTRKSSKSKSSSRKKRPTNEDKEIFDFYDIDEFKEVGDTYIAAIQHGIKSIK